MSSCLIVPRHKLLARKFCNKWMNGCNYPRTVLLFGNFNAKTKCKLRIMARKYLIDHFAICDPDTFKVRIEVMTTYSNSHQTKMIIITVSAEASGIRVLYFSDIISKTNGNFKHHSPSKDVFLSTDDYAKSIYANYNIYGMVEHAKQRLIKNHNLFKQLKP